MWSKKLVLFQPVDIGLQWFAHVLLLWNQHMTDDGWKESFCGMNPHDWRRVTCHMSLQCGWNLTELCTGLHNKMTGRWFGTFSIFPYIGNVIIPIDFHIFQRGRAQPPTRWSESWKIPGPSGIQGASTHGEPPPAVAPMPRKKETPVPYLPMDQHVSDVQLLQAQSGCCYWAVEGSDVWHFYGIYV